MRLAKTISLLVIVLCSSRYENVKGITPEDEKADSLLSVMTLDEKIGQLNQLTVYDDFSDGEIRRGEIGSFLSFNDTDMINRLQRIAVEGSRLGIPLIFGNGILHGYKTVFPIPLAQSCSWNPDLVEEAARIAAVEARPAGIHWTWSPMLDIARDARWGRIAEGAGEDPFLCGEIGRAFVRGYQKNGLDSDGALLACLKHYVGYGAAIAGKDYNTVDMSERLLRDIYLPPFKACIEEGALTVMSSFNLLNGIPATANYFTLTRILRREWGFSGFVVSDWDAVGELLTHGFARDTTDAALKAFLAGLDMDMKSGVYRRSLAGLVKNGVVSSAALDDAVKRILKIKFTLGLFDRPFGNTSQAKRVAARDEHRECARRLARQSMVLLKNENRLLPLGKKVSSIAVIGPLANSTEELLGMTDFPETNTGISILEGIKRKTGPATRVTFAPGCDIEGNDRSGFAEAVQAARAADVALLVVGEGRTMSGEAGSRAFLDLPGAQLDLIKTVQETGTPVVMVLFSGRPLAIPWCAEHLPAILLAWFPGIEGGNAVADILFGDYNPSGKLSASFPRTVGQEPLYYNHDNTGRPPVNDERWFSKYLDAPVTPLYPFGFGLSYTEFTYENLNLSTRTMTKRDSLGVSAVITNMGPVVGEEIVQLYIRDRVSSLVRPVRELKGFQRIKLAPGEKRTITFTLGPGILGFHNPDMNFVVEAGLFDVWIGGNSVEGLHETFEIIE